MASPSQVQVIRQNLMASPSQVQVIRQNLMASQVQVQARDLDLDLTWTWTWICDLYPTLKNTSVNENTVPIEQIKIQKLNGFLN